MFDNTPKLSVRNLLWVTLAANLIVLPIFIYRSCYGGRADRVELHCAADAMRFCEAVELWNAVSECEQSLDTSGRVQREYERLLARRAPTEVEAQALQAVVEATNAVCHQPPSPAP